MLIALAGRRGLTLRGAARQGEHVQGRESFLRPERRAAHRGWMRFSQLRTSMPELIARTLALTPKQLQHADPVERAVHDGYPPATYLHLTRQGRRLSQLIRAL